jgi:cytohesin
MTKSSATIRFLDGHGCDIRLNYANGKSPFMIAIEKQSLDVLNYLIEAGIEPDEEVIDGDHTPLMWACLKGNAAIVQILLANKSCNPDYVFENGWTAMHIAAQRGDAEIVGLLVARGANVNAVTGFGTTPTHAAANEKAWGVVELLVASGGQMDIGPVRLR